MKKIVLLFLTLAMATVAGAQPTRRLQEQQAQKEAEKSPTAVTISERARSQYTAQTAMPTEVQWRRDIYRELDLKKEKNAALYYPEQPLGDRVNFFTLVLNLILDGKIKAYEYRLDGNEVFNDSSRVKMKTVLENYHIYHEEKDGKLRVDNSDIPSAEVKLYYLKESAYFDQANSSFHRKVQAICPVMLREDDFGGEASKYPLFWVKYADLEPFLSRQTLMTSNLNNAATMSMEDYFTLNRYEGKIYKTNNMLGKTLAQYCPTDSALAKEQKKIEAELLAFEQNIFGDKHRKDSLDSIAKLDPQQMKIAAKQARKGNTARARKSTAKSRSVSSSSGSARVTVRRQRH
jgi:gliding motility associated protien GldN